MDSRRPCLRMLDLWAKEILLMNESIHDAAFVEHGAALAVQQGTKTAVWTPSFAMGVDEAVARVAAKHDFFRRVMREGDHYGVIPGTSTKPALYKPGAELLLANMGLQAEFTDASEPTVDYGEEGREGLIHYRRVCRIFRQIGNHEDERMQVARAEGSCTSREVKYRWRTSGSECPACGKALRMSKDKPEWYCWRKQGGCGKTYPEAQFKFERVINPDLGDIENTILKMADKRALVAATLIATGCSDIFTQDIEDADPFPPDSEMRPVGPSVAASASNAAPVPKPSRSVAEDQDALARVVSKAVDAGVIDLEAGPAEMKAWAIASGRLPGGKLTPKALAEIERDLDADLANLANIARLRSMLKEKMG